ncbi:hypothetical protein AgCh_030894 [Apium graveolens]
MAPRPSNNRFDSKKPRSEVRSSTYGPRDGTRANAAAGNSKKKGSSRLAGKDGKTVDGPNQNTGIDLSNRSGIIGHKTSGKGGSSSVNIEENSVLNPLYQSTVHGLTVDDVVIDGMNGEVKGGSLQEESSSVLDGIVSKVTVVSQGSVVKDVAKVFEEMPLRNPVENSTEGVIGGQLGGNVNIPVDSSSHGLDSEMGAPVVFDNMQN